MKDVTKEYLKTILKGISAVFLIPGHKTHTVFRRALNLGVTFI